jgi:hypothetical protein
MRINPRLCFSQVCRVNAIDICQAITTKLLANRDVVIAYTLSQGTLNITSLKRYATTSQRGIESDLNL